MGWGLVAKTTEQRVGRFGPQISSAGSTYVVHLRRYVMHGLLLQLKDVNYFRCSAGSEQSQALQQLKMVIKSPIIEDDLMLWSETESSQVLEGCLE